MNVNPPATSGNYILNISQISDHELQFVGDSAFNLGLLSKLGAPIPSGFVLTGKAFDDFLFSNGLIQNIGNVIQKYQQGQITPEKAEANVLKFIQEGKFPGILHEMLFRAYDLLCSGNKIQLKIENSSLTPGIKESLLATNQTYLIAESFDEFLDTVKLSWATLFHREAIKKRSKDKYKGIISTALLITKFVQPEVSGSIFTMGVDTANPDIIELRTVLGLEVDEVANNSFDRYLFQKNTESILAKQLNPQKWMYVFKDRKFSKVQISENRIKTQKLTDAQIILLSRVVANFKENLKNELKINWSYQAGRYLFLGLSRLRESDIIVARESLKSFSEKKVKNTKDSLTSLPGFQLQPLNKLPKLIQGNGNSNGLIYGRIKIIRSRADLSKVEGVDILVIEKQIPNFKTNQVKYRGLIVERNIEITNTDIPVIKGARDARGLLLENEIVTLDSDSGIVYLGAGFRPVVHSQPQKIVEHIKPETINAKEITISMNRSINQGLLRGTSKEASKFNSEGNWMVDKNTLNNKNIELLKEDNTESSVSVKVPYPTGMSEEWYLKEPVKKDVNLDMNGPSKYWQIFNPENPVLIPNSEGIYIKLSKILTTLDLDKHEIIRNKPMQRKFMTFIGEYFEKLKECKQVLILLDMMSTTSETVKEAEVMEFQVELIAFLRNKLLIKNISIVLPDTRDYKTISHLKKTFTANGLKRTNTFQILSETVSPLSIISVQKIIDEGVDGVFLDLDKLLINLAGKSNARLTFEILDFLTELIVKVSKNAIAITLAVNEVRLNEDSITSFVKAGVVNYVFSASKITELPELIKDYEEKLITNTSRKVKRKSNQ